MIRYYRLITEVDAAVGRLVDELKAQGVYENTLIAFIGDNGYFHGDRGLADKWYPYEQALRVPLIVRDPRVTARARGVDAGPAGPQHRRGADDRRRRRHARTGRHAGAGPRSSVPDGRTPPAWRDEFFYEHPTITSRDRIPSSQGVIRRDWKYVYFPEFDYEQLFNLKEDAEEIRNLAQDPAHAGQRAKMRQKLEEWRERAR